MPRMRTRPLKVEAPELRLDPDATLERVDWREIFNREGDVEIEVGIGKGRFLLAAATSRPDTLHLGVEWANHYLRIVEARAFKNGLTNIRFIRVDVHELLPQIPESSVTSYYVFYPDPWPKKRHHKRRFFQPRSVVELTRTLIDGGVLHAATDHDEYWEVIEPLLDGEAEFERLPEFGGDGFPASTEESLTNFEAKYRAEGRSRHRGSWRRRARGATKTC